MIRKLLLLAALAAGGFGAWTYWRVARAESGALSAAREAQSVPFLRSTVQTVGGFETVASPADYRDAAIWNQALYVASANTLARYREDGSFDKQWRAGFELPAAPLQSLAAEEKLWVATEGEGVLVFDGERFEQILPSPANARKIRAVLPLASGAVLIATGGMGVLRFDGSVLRPFLEGVQATALAGVEDDLWIGTRDAGTLHIRAGQTERLGGEPVYAIAAAAGVAYAATATGIARYEGGKLERILASGVFARSLYLRGEELYAGTLNDGWLRIPSRAAREDSGEVRRIFGSGEDIYIVRPDSVGVLRDGKTLRAVERESALLTHANISALHADPAGRLWIGYFDRGLDIVEANRERKTHIEDDRVFCVNQITASQDGQRVAVATANGLVMFDAAGVPRQTITKSEGLAASHVTAVVPNGSGWIAGTPAGITFLDASPRSIYAFHGLVNNHVYAVARLGEEVLAGTLGGVSQLNGEQVKRGYTSANSGLKTNWTTALARVGSEWWAGTYGGGVQRLSTAGEWHTFETMPANVVVNPNALLATAGAVYAGTLQHGLLVWDSTSRTWRSHRRGLPSANVTAILYHDNRLFVGTDNGLVTAPESQFQQ